MAKKSTVYSKVDVEDQFLALEINTSCSRWWSSLSCSSFVQSLDQESKLSFGVSLIDVRPVFWFAGNEKRQSTSWEWCWREDTCRAECRRGHLWRVVDARFAKWAVCRSGASERRGRDWLLGGWIWRERSIHNLPNFVWGDCWKGNSVLAKWRDFILTGGGKPSIHSFSSCFAACYFLLRRNYNEHFKEKILKM